MALKITSDTMSNSTFQGWLGKGPEAGEGKMEWGTFEPKTWTEDDVDIQVTHCGVCGSDLHVLSSAWGPTTYRKLVCPACPMSLATILCPPH